MPTLEELRRLNSLIQSDPRAPKTCALELVEAVRRHQTKCKACKHAKGHPPDVAKCVQPTLADVLRSGGKGIRNVPGVTGPQITWALRWIEARRLEALREKYDR